MRDSTCQQDHAQYQPSNVYESDEQEKTREYLLAAQEIQFPKNRKKKHAAEVKSNTITPKEEDRGENETPS